MPKIWMLAREKPHCGVSGVPFMKSTTGADATALSIAARVSEERQAFWRTANRGERKGLRRGRTAWLATWMSLAVVETRAARMRTVRRADLEIILMLLLKVECLR